MDARGEIVKWQDSLSRDEGIGIEADGSSSSTPDGLTTRLRTAASQIRSLEREYDYLRLWADGYGLFSGELDKILAASKRLRHSTNRLLVGICQTLSDNDLKEDDRRSLSLKSARVRDITEAAVYILRGDEGSDNDSDAESDSESARGTSSIEDIIDDLKTNIQCLVDLGPRYEEPIQDKAVAEEEAVSAPQPTIHWDLA
ncbi:hypothetical protein B0H63DRAFT_525976 [Podospora didyma]|uniref:Uncharacterized protein n=1 Tax=Podospora didyma TaxID=330526 RepID=A0AAE0KEG6_9PEZI|nr:hypothetical protein B0H63DRAFT_525976 [Podospora didyma]